jgi:hypothetical protein
MPLGYALTQTQQADPRPDKALAKLKGEMRKAKPRTIDAICETIREILNRFSSKDVEITLANAGCAPT